jgi:hypothetical protein
MAEHRSARGADDGGGSIGAHAEATRSAAAPASDDGRRRQGIEHPASTGDWSLGRVVPRRVSHGAGGVNGDELR